MYGSRSRIRFLPRLVPQLVEICTKSSSAEHAQLLLKLSPCQACYVRKLNSLFGLRRYGTNLGHERTKVSAHAPRARYHISAISRATTDVPGQNGNVAKATTTSDVNAVHPPGGQTSTPAADGTGQGGGELKSPAPKGGELKNPAPGGGELKSPASEEKSGQKVVVTAKTVTEQPLVTIPSVKSGSAARKSKRAQIDWSAVYYDNTYVTPIRALNEYMLISADLESLPKYTRRSPFVGVGNMSVYLKHDIETKAYAVWGGKESFLKEKERRRLSQEAGDVTATLFKKALKQYRRTSRKSEYDRPKPYEGDVRATNVGSVFSSGTGKVVLYAICINFANCLLKSAAWLYTGSHCMFAEAIHSAADTLNQVILAVGIHQSIKVPDREHPYGYDNLRYVSSLISGVGIFCIGAGLSWYHGIQGLLHPESVESLQWAIAILVGSLISEGATLVMALNQARAAAQREGTSLLQYVRGGFEPSTNVVLLEDLAAVAGVVVAASCMAATAYTGNVIFDASGSIAIGFLLGSVASFIIYTNSQALVGRSIPAYQTAKMCQLLESDRMIRALHDVKATDMGGKFVRFKAEVDFDGKELTRSYLDKVDMDSLLIEMHSLKTMEEVEDFMLRHGEKIVDALGMEIDRIEQKMIKRFPKVRHVDLEIL